jgi:hypothetical protein
MFLRLICCVHHKFDSRLHDPLLQINPSGGTLSAGMSASSSHQSGTLSAGISGTVCSGIAGTLYSGISGTL